MALKNIYILLGHIIVKSFTFKSIDSQYYNASLYPSEAMIVMGDDHFYNNESLAVTPDHVIEPKNISLDNPKYVYLFTLQPINLTYVLQWKSFFHFYPSFTINYDRSTAFSYVYGIKLNYSIFNETKNRGANFFALSLPVKSDNLNESASFMEKVNVTFFFDLQDQILTVNQVIVEVNLTINKGNEMPICRNVTVIFHCQCGRIHGNFTLNDTHPTNLLTHVAQFSAPEYELPHSFSFALEN